MQFGCDDPEAWLDAQADEKLALWQGYYEVEPQGAEWERHSEQMSMLDQVLAVLINTNQGKDATPYKAREANEFLPDGWRDKPAVDPDAQVQAASQLGTKGARVVYGNQH